MNKSYVDYKLQDCGPLSDPIGHWLKVVRILFGVSTVAAVFKALELLGIFTVEPAGSAGQAAVILAALLSLWFLLWPCFALAHGQDRVLYLGTPGPHGRGVDRRLRARLRAALPSRVRLSAVGSEGGYRPRWRRVLSDALMIFRFARTNRPDLYAAKHNWKARLLASFAESHAVIIDLRERSDGAEYDIGLALRFTGQPDRIFFLINSARSIEAWTEEMEKVHQAGPELRHVTWIEFREDEDSKTRLGRWRDEFISIPTETMTVPHSAFEYTDRHAAGDWKTRASESPWVPTSLSFALWGSIVLLIWRIAGWNAILLGALSLLVFFSAILPLLRQIRSSYFVLRAGKRTPSAALPLFCSLATVGAVVLLGVSLIW